MPLYEVTHTAPLDSSQKDALAEAITEIHSRAFLVPRFYINVFFTDASHQPTYVGGRRRATNRITGRVRRGPTRTQDDFNALCTRINAAWRRIVHPDIPISRLPPRELELGAVFITGELLAGMKVGFPVPTAGNETPWVEEHFSAFKDRAALGDEDFVEFVAELEKKEAWF
ncbi:hypothetical protein ACJZ2D_007387 [Fusarium nematophilum]